MSPANPPSWIRRTGRSISLHARDLVSGGINPGYDLIGVSGGSRDHAQHVGWVLNPRVLSANRATTPVHAPPGPGPRRLFAGGRGGRLPVGRVVAGVVGFGMDRWSVLPRPSGAGGPGGHVAVDDLVHDHPGNRGRPDYRRAATSPGRPARRRFERLPVQGPTMVTPGPAEPCCRRRGRRLSREVSTAGSKPTITSRPPAGIDVPGGEVEVHRPVETPGGRGAVQVHRLGWSGCTARCIPRWDRSGGT